MGWVEFLFLAPAVAVLTWLVARPRRMLYQPPEGWYWEYDPDYYSGGRFPRFSLFCSDGKEVGSFSANVYKLRLERYWKSREIVRNFTKLDYTGDPFLDGFRVKRE